MAVGNIDLSKVSISLAEFQKMYDGKYNAIDEACQFASCGFVVSGLQFVL